MIMADAPKKEAAPKPKAPKKVAPYKEGKKRCPKCQSRLAEHKDRLTCGKCRYTEFLKQDKK